MPFELSYHVNRWASEKGWHGRGGHEEAISLDSFKTYWNAFLGQCEWFKERKMGWYVHTYSDFFELVSSTLEQDDAR